MSLINYSIMVTKLLWKYDLIADSTFNAWHEGYVDGILMNEPRYVAETEYTMREINTSKIHWYLCAYYIGRKQRGLHEFIKRLNNRLV